MASDNYSHNFEIEDKKAYNLPGKKLSPETRIPGWNRWVCFIFISFNYVFLYHFCGF
jgi:hypothetical protein